MHTKHIVYNSSVYTIWELKGENQYKGWACTYIQTCMWNMFINKSSRVFICVLMLYSHLLGNVKACRLKIIKNVEKPLLE